MDNFKRKNHYEVLRCYDQLIRSHPEKLISGLLLRLNSVDENIRVSTLIVFRHLMNSSLDLLQPRMSDIFSAFHSKLNETSNRVRKMLAQLTALLGSLGFLEGHKGRDFLEFIVKLSALPTLENQRSFAVTSNDILQYLTASDYSSSNYSIGNVQFIYFFTLDGVLIIALKYEFDLLKKRTFVTLCRTHFVLMIFFRAENFKTSKFQFELF